MTFLRTHTLILVITLLGLTAMPDMVMAQQPPANMLDNCTQSPFFDYDNNPVNQAQDMLQEVIDEIDTAVQSASEDLFTAFTSDGNYPDIITAAFMLVLIFFAVSFMFGFVTLTLLQALIRLVKIGMIIWMMSAAGLAFLDEYFVQFFNEGGAWLINAMINIATTGAVGNPGTSVSAPFAVLDEIIQIVFSPRMFVTIIAAVSTGPFGILVAGALVWSVFSIFMALLKALQIYAISIVIKAVLLGLMPVFLPMMLFERTKSFFMGWVNQLVNFTLQPILLFAFLAFFATLIASAARDILPPDDVHACYVKADNQAATPFDTHNWKFMCCSGGACQPYEGKHTHEGPIECNGAPIFPVNHVNVLVFLLLTHIMKQLTTVATAIAAEISQGAMKLDQIPNAVNDWFAGMGSGGAKSAAGRHDHLRFIGQ